MLEYAYRKSDKNKKLQFIDEVDNGNDCDCICPHCEDDLTANNRGEIKRHYFSHQNKNENRDCLMTQLHLVAQKYFNEITVFQIPDVELPYKNQILIQLSTAAEIASSTMEHPIGKYISDVYLNTDEGPFSIEIRVTHACEEDKIRYCQEIELPTIEYDLSPFRDLDIQKVINRLKENSVDYYWIYPWRKKKLIEEYEAKVALQEKQYLESQIFKAKSSASKLIRLSAAELPRLDEKITHLRNGIEYSKNITLVEPCFYKLDSLEVESENQDCLILKGEKNKGTARVLWLVYLYTPGMPSALDSLKGSVLVSGPAYCGNLSPKWRWFRHVKRQKLLREMEPGCKMVLARTAQADEDIKRYAQQFENNKKLFSDYYGRWLRWMIDRKLFIPSYGNETASIPKFLKVKRSYPSLWVFNVWPIYVLSVLADIVDSFSDPIITYDELFYKLDETFPLLPEFNLIEEDFDESISHTRRNLYVRSEIIKEALKPYQLLGLVDLSDDSVCRKNSLLSSLKM